MTKSTKEQTGFKAIHLSLRRELVKKLDAKAEAEQRTRINMIAVLLEKALSQEVSA